jgi:hypothetical protein
LKGIIPHKGGGQKDRYPERTPPRRADKRDNSEHDKEIYEDRKEVCRLWNTATGRSKKDCLLIHGCNRRASKGKCCKNKNHTAPDHI